MNNADAEQHGAWNHNIHYHPVVLDAVPDGCREALDVGCGTGILARKLAGLAGQVTGVDRSADMIRLARERSAGIGNVTYVQADFLDALGRNLPEGGYDFVGSVAVIHHMDFAGAVDGMVRLLAPGGTLVIVGLARDRAPLDWLTSAAAVPVTRYYAAKYGRRRNPDGVPVMDAGMSWSQVRSAGRELLPGSQYRRHLLWRYSLVWTKPR